eukprot:3178295-Pyramimonas_sp.AAC.1
MGKQRLRSAESRSNRQLRGSALRRHAAGEQPTTEEQRALNLKRLKKEIDDDLDELHNGGTIQSSIRKTPALGGREHAAEGAAQEERGRRGQEEGGRRRQEERGRSSCESYPAGPDQRGHQADQQARRVQWEGSGLAEVVCDHAGLPRSGVRPDAGAHPESRELRREPRQGGLGPGRRPAGRTVVLHPDHVAQGEHDGEARDRRVRRRSPTVEAPDGGVRAEVRVSQDGPAAGVPQLHLQQGRGPAEGHRQARDADPPVPGRHQEDRRRRHPDRRAAEGAGRRQRVAEEAGRPPRSQR